MRALIVSRTAGARGWIRSAVGPDWETDEAADGREALRLLGHENVDLVVADESSEPFGAFGLARELKILPNPPAVIVVLERAQDVWLARWSGADRWFVQPVDPFELAEAARALGVEAGAAEPTTAGG